MNQETKLFIDISAQLGKLNSNMETVLNQLTDHNCRIAKLENGKVSFKDDIISCLIKGLVASIAIVGSLTGSAGLISKFLN